MKHHQGMTLVELLIAMVVGLLVLLAASQAYLTAINTQRSQTDLTRLGETGRFAFLLVSRELQKAGFRNIWQVGTTATSFCRTTPTGAAIAGCNDQAYPATFDPATAGQTIPSCTGTNGNAQVANGSDVLRVRYFGEDATTTTSVTDCHGNAVARDTLVEDTLYVDQDATTGEPALFCHTSNPASTAPASRLPLVVGVESLQLLYGIDGNADGVVDRYLPWHMVASGSNTDNIIAVAVSVVVRSPSAVAIAQTSPITTFNHFGAYSSGTPTPAPATSNNDPAATFTAPAPWDRRLRLAMSSEITARNFRLCP